MSGVSVTQLLIAFTICIGSIFLYKTSSRDPYGLLHLALNREPGEDLGSNGQKTEWLNQGYWKVGFPLGLTRTNTTANGDSIIRRIRILSPELAEVFTALATT